MISSLAHEIAHWVAIHQGVRPSRIRVPQAVIDECLEEGRHLGLVKDKRLATKDMRIAGVLVCVDPTMTIGKIDP